jgi:hypothetical protein
MFKSLSVSLAAMAVEAYAQDATQQYLYIPINIQGPSNPAMIPTPPPITGPLTPPPIPPITVPVTPPTIAPITTPVVTPITTPVVPPTTPPVGNGTLKIAPNMQIVPIQSKKINGASLKTLYAGAQFVVPLKSVHVDAKLDSGLATSVVTLEFDNNHFSENVEVTFEYPIAGTQVVDSIYAEVGSDILETKVKNRADAEQEYEDAVAAGKTALHADREEETDGDIFSFKLGNLAPGEKVKVIMTLLDSNTELVGGSYAYTIPHKYLMPQYWASDEVQNEVVAQVNNYAFGYNASATATKGKKINFASLPPTATH